jgi:hypothetical protein
MCVCVSISVYACFLIRIQPKFEALKPGLPRRDMGRFSISQTCLNVLKLTHPLGHGSGSALLLKWPFGVVGVIVLWLLKKSIFLKTAKILGIENVHLNRESCL